MLAIEDLAFYSNLLCQFPESLSLGIVVQTWLQLRENPSSSANEESGRSEGYSRTRAAWIDGEREELLVRSSSVF